jgi:hypothetical protein
MKEVQLFVDCMIPEGQTEAPENSHKAVEFVDKVKHMLVSILIINIIPIRTYNDKKELINNGVTKLPTLLDNKKTFVGIDSIKANINKYINGTKRRQKDDTEQLREEQMAEMDMDKYEAGEYDDDEGNEDDMFRKGDKDAQRENIQQKIAHFNSRRKGRVEETKGTKRGSKKKKPTKHRPRQDNNDPEEEPDNIEVEDNDEQPRRGRGGGGGGGGTDLKVEDWDNETQQLLDKAGN